MKPGGGLLPLGLLSLLAGAMSGLLAALFRLALRQADHLRDSLAARAHDAGWLGLIASIAAVAAAAALAAWLVRTMAPEAVGSGIPQVEGALRGERPYSTWNVLPVKFAGGVLAIGGGLALGREGPTVQMGGTVARLVSRYFRRPPLECAALFAAGAGAGLATAFNAPIAGAIFALEELLGRFELRSAIATLGASAAAIGVARFLLGQAPDFQVAPVPFSGMGATPMYFVVGGAAGLLGVAYSRAIVSMLRQVERLPPHPAELRAAVIGGAVGAVAWLGPGLVGSGDTITQTLLNSGGPILTIALTCALRFVLGALSYAAATPGGLFAPMLVLGAQCGLLSASLVAHWPAAASTPPAEYAIVGMAAFFAAVVRAPLTGIVLAIELTGAFTTLLPMLIACFTSTLMADMLGCPPIYESLRPAPLPAASGTSTPLPASRSF